MKTQENKTEGEQIKETLQFWLHYWYIFVISLIVCGAIAWIYLKTTTPVFNVAAKVNLRHDESLLGTGSVARTQSIMSAFGMGGGTENIEDEIKKMSSHGYVKEIAKNLDLNKIYTQLTCFGFVKKPLYDQSPVVLSVDPEIADTMSVFISFILNIKPELTKIKMKIGKQTIGKYEITSYPATIQTSLGQFTFEKSPYYEGYNQPLNLKITYASYDFIAQIYQKMLSIGFEKKSSDLIDMKMAGENIPFIKKVLLEMIAIYNKKWVEDKDLVSSKTIDFIDSRLLLSKDMLANVDNQIQQFKDKYNLTEIEADVKSYLTISGELQAQLLTAETQLNIVDIIVDFVSDEKNKYSLIPFNLSLNDQNMATVISKYNDELIKRNELYKNNVQSALARSLDEVIEVQRKNLLVTLENTRKSAQITLANLKKKDKENNAKMGKIPAIEKDYINLRREQEVQQSIYVFLLEKREEIGIRGINLLPKLKIIDAPYVVIKPVSPDRMKVAITTLFFGGIIFPLSAIYSLPFVNNYIRKRKEK
ncbi:MAG: hypothetical protein FWF52_10920 [Candidatus Azobacteroides sp.]|nr:hypothetical protein [Candidatus Azobacteroides sp.]